MNVATFVATFVSAKSLYPNDLSFKFDSETKKLAQTLPTENISIIAISEIAIYSLFQYKSKAIFLFHCFSKDKYI